MKEHTVLYLRRRRTKDLEKRIMAVVVEDFLGLGYFFYLEGWV